MDVQGRVLWLQFTRTWTSIEIEVQADVLARTRTSIEVEVQADVPGTNSLATPAPGPQEVGTARLQALGTALTALQVQGISCQSSNPTIEQVTSKFFCMEHVLTA